MPEQLVLTASEPLEKQVLRHCVVLLQVLLNRGHVGVFCCRGPHRHSFAQQVHAVRRVRPKGLAPRVGSAPRGHGRRGGRGSAAHLLEEEVGGAVPPVNEGRVHRVDQDWREAGASVHNTSMY
jgi:hypothetical protein